MKMEVQMEHRLTAVEDRSKSNQKRLDDLEKRQDNLDDLVSTVKVLAVREETVENDVKEIKDDVKRLASKPAEKWDKLTELILSALVGIIVGFIFSQIGM
jgi:predicted  nucleic acid-binding Zn-ribbon protein